jgi:hypothetical protein
MLLESPPAKTHAQLVKRERREIFYHENPDSNMDTQAGRDQGS